jgi:hypothetical protein
VWSDNRDGNFEIYYKRNPTAGFPVGMDDKQDNISGGAFMVGPDPAYDYLTIHLKGSFDKILHADLTDLSGRILLQKTFVLSENGDAFSINVSDLPCGVYILKGSAGDKQYFKKVIIAR